MVLKAAPYGGFVFEPLELQKAEGQPLQDRLRDINNKMEVYIKEGVSQGVQERLLESLKYPHPAIFPVKHKDKALYLVVLPIMHNPSESERLCFLVQNEENLDFSPPLLKEDSWHEINNPLAIISLTLQKIFKKETLDQSDIDTLLDRISSCFGRIESFIVGQMQSENSNC